MKEKVDMDIQLNFINESNLAGKPTIVIFQKNVVTNFDESAVAWRVIDNCGVGDNQPFLFPLATEINAIDRWGNHSPRLLATNGQLFCLRWTNAGSVLSMCGQATAHSQVQLRNDLPQDAIDAAVYRGDKLLAIKKAIAPGQMATFDLRPSIWIGAMSGVVPGGIVDGGAVLEGLTELSLLGIVGADIVMSGGGTEPMAPPLSFSLRNKVFA